MYQLGVASNLVYSIHQKETRPMSKTSTLSRTEHLYNIQRDLDFLTRWAETRPGIFAQVVTDQELEQLEEIVTRLVAGFEKETDTD